MEFKGRSYRNFDGDKFKETIMQENWEGLYTCKTPDQAWALLLDKVVPVIDSMCPLRSFSITNYRPDWMTNELIEQIKDRDYFYKKAKKKGGADSWNIARHLRNVTNANIRQAKRDFILEKLEVNQNNAKKFWKVIREVVPTDKGAKSADILLKDKGVYINKEEVSHFINDYFINIGNYSAVGPADITEDHKEDSGVMPSPPTEDRVGTVPLMYFEQISKTEVLKVVKEINISKSSGLENISSFIVKVMFTALAPQIAHLMNLSLTTSSFPAAWKVALVIPIPKSGNLSMVKNYRPISLLPLPGKILEKLVHSQLSNYLDAERLLSPNQHGFRKGRSTINSIAQLTDFVNKKLDSHLPTLVTYIDFRKAFDCVQHPMLLKKLVALNLDKPVVKWIESYLSSRKQRVLANNVLSSYLPITQGVPQGSVLGPLFYIIYANDLVKCKKTLTPFQLGVLLMVSV